MDKSTITRIAIHHERVTPKTVWSFVALTLDDATTGWGEATIPKHLLLDAPAADAARAWQGQPVARLLRELAAREATALPQAAIASALEQAAWDALGRARGCRAVDLIGKVVRERVTLYGNMNRRTVDRTPAGFHASARETIAAGFDAVKIAPFDDVTPELVATPAGRQLVAAGMQRIAAVRDAIGSSRQLYVDCHWRLTTGVAADLLDELAQLGVSWFECPVPESEAHIHPLRELRGRANVLGIRLAGLESFTSPEAFRPWLAAGAYDVVMPDVKYAGGIRGVVAVAELAARHGAACAPHNPTGPVCHAASLAACALAPAADLLECQFDETPRFWELAGPALPRIVGGASDVPCGVGLGVELNVADDTAMRSAPAS